MMKKLNLVRTIILAGSLLLQLSTLCFHSRPANPKLNGRRAALCLAALIAGLGLIPAGRVTAQTFTTLHSFNGENGGLPYAGLILSGNSLYGTAAHGGSSDTGMVFAVNTDGTGFTTLHSFIYDSDGANPVAGLILSGNAIYGTAQYGGSWENGTVFKVNTNGTDFTTLYSFSFAFYNPSPTNSDGVFPEAGLILSGNTLYGTASSGGSSGNGTVFAVNADGTGFMNLHTFTAGSGSIPNVTNSDGALPIAGLILSGNTLYGTANQGGSSGKGTVFSLSLPLPQLTIIRSGANVILTWPTNAAGFTLQSTTNLSLPNSWSPVAQTAVTNGNQASVTIPATSVRMFFRLKSQ